VYPADPVVLTEYQEDLGEKAADGSYGYEYRYWVYWIDLDGRRYRARIYTDTAHDADVMHLDGPHPPEYEDDLRTIGDYLRQDAGVQTISTLGPSGEYEPVIRFE
jgi:hypothetical protein